MRRSVLLAALLVGLSGCGPGLPSRVRLDPDVVRPPRGAVIFLVDGLPGGLVAQGCRERWLPTIQTRFADGGCRVEHALTTVPSITYAAIATLLTGVEPARHGVIGNRWFDPTTALFRDYTTLPSYRTINGDFAPATLYELIRPEPSASIQAAHVRGVTHDIANWAPSGVMWYFGDYTAVDKLTATSVDELARRANWDRRWPTVVMFYFPGLDTIGHLHGPESLRFRGAMEHTDYQIGRICAWLDRQRLTENTHLVLVSDHGMVDSGSPGQVDLLILLRDGWGRRVTRDMRQDGGGTDRRRFYDRFDTVLNDQDGRRASLHFRSTRGWSGPPTPDEVAAILNAPPVEQQLWSLAGVDLVAYLADGGSVVLRSSRGTARIRGAGGTRSLPATFAYEPAPDDVLGYLDDPELAAFVADGFHLSREWLVATAEQSYPDLVPHLIPLLNLRRAGQVVLFAQPGYSFAVERGGHGGVSRDDRHMTFMLAGPDIPPGSTIATARASDLVPTVLDLMGAAPPHGVVFDGVSLRPQLKSLSEPATSRRAGSGPNPAPDMRPGF